MIFDINQEASREIQIFAYAKAKAQNSCAVPAQLISTFVSAILTVQLLYFSKFGNFKLLDFFCSCTGWFVSYPVRNPEVWFSRVTAQIIQTKIFVKFTV